MRQKKAKKVHYWILIGLQHDQSEKGYSWCKGTADKSSVDEQRSFRYSAVFTQCRSSGPVSNQLITLPSVNTPLVPLVRFQFSSNF